LRIRGTKNSQEFSDHRKTEFFNSIGCEAALQQAFLDLWNLNGGFRRDRSFKLLDKPFRRGRESASNGPQLSLPQY
jgi:hypothetical protein